MLQGENNELLKELHDNKVQIDNLQHVKHQLAQQLEEARRRLEDAERVSHLGHAHTHECGDSGAFANASATASSATGVGRRARCTRRGIERTLGRRTQTVVGEHGNIAVEEQVRRRGVVASRGGGGSAVCLWVIHMCTSQHKKQ
jgi:hypothetical protein